MSLVIKSWFAKDTANENGNYVHIVGRASGLISWILSLLKIDAVSEVEVQDDLIKFTQSSLSGREIRIIPLKSITSAFYAYEKPWKKVATIISLSLAFMLMGMFGLADGSLVGLGFFGIVGGVIYYVLSKKLKVAVVDASGWTGSFAFKRSVIEGQNINEEQAYQVIEIIRTLIEKKTS